MQQLRISIDGDGTGDEARSLQDWLLDVPELRGRLTAAQAPPPPGKLGPVLEAVLVALGPGGAAAAAAAAVVAWIRHRSSDVTVRITRADGAEVEVTATRVRKLDQAALRAETDRLAALLGRELPPTPPRP
ncbi:effector-associated constant component EACC1 [Micromonospora carbonacea]|uniref:Uncharacterized protein n=1 Tax=Micromonospora carbonacea TaxID=47853 RepID=A0A1C4ZH75_9ACTN|nr:hypothetical protein [Micromonospora carbonacea]SCF32352.1 hypothetical protein GA0070563_108181 [Micromonospora carbonacea]